MSYTRTYSPLLQRCRAIFLLLFVILFTLGLQGCDKRGALSPVSNSGTILAFGDSLTAGYGVNIENSYPSVLARLSKRRVVNAGISGEVTEEGLARLAKVLDDSSPELMILLEGGNDILRNQPLSKAKQNLSKMIVMAKEKGVQVVLIGVPEKKLFSDSASIYGELAEEHKLVFDPKLISSLIKKPKFKSDSVHFNKAGYEKMADEIYQLLENEGAL